MPTIYDQQTPNMLKDDSGNVIEVHHNHSVEPAYKYLKGYGYGFIPADIKKELVVREKAQLKNCITFFKAITNDKEATVLEKASAKAALNADKALLTDYNQRECQCSIM